MKSKNQILAIAEALFPAFLITHKDVLGGREGIYLAINWIGDEIEHLSGKIIGKLPEEKEMEKADYAKNKIQGMIENKVICSFLCEDVDNKIFGGGIKGFNYHIAPSGLPPHLDQKFAILVLLTADELGVSDYMDIMNESLLKVNEWRKKNNQRAIPLSKF